MENNLIKTIIILLVLAGLIVGCCFLQKYLSKRESRWPGLILPFIAFCVSLLYIFGMAVLPGETLNTAITMIGIFLLCNIPTGILLAIYIACREKLKLKRSIEKMSVQDLK